MKQLELSVTTGSLVTSVTESGQLVGIPKLVSYLITVVSDIVLIYYHNSNSLKINRSVAANLITSNVSGCHCTSCYLYMVHL